MNTIYEGIERLSTGNAARSVPKLVYELNHLSRDLVDGPWPSSSRCPFGVNNNNGVGCLKSPDQPISGTSIATSNSLKVFR